MLQWIEGHLYYKKRLRVTFFFSRPSPPSSYRPTIVITLFEFAAHLRLAAFSTPRESCNPNPASTPREPVVRSWAATGGGIFPGLVCSPPGAITRVLERRRRRRRHLTRPHEDFMWRTECRCCRLLRPPCRSPHVVLSPPASVATF